jgi:hypothetical protein
MTRFRYDVVLHVEPVQCPGPCPPDVWRDWRDAPLDASAIRERLASAQPSYFGLRHVTNARLATELRIKRWLAEDAGGDTVGALRLAIDKAPRLGVDPEALWELAQGNPYAVDIRCEPESADGDIAVLFTRHGSPPVEIDSVLAPPPRPFADCANNPLREKATRAFVPELMRDLKAALPQHMIPASIMVLDSFPVASEREGRPAGAPAAGFRYPLPRTIRGAMHRHAAGSAERLGCGAGRRQSRHSRQLLRAWRT